MPKDLVFITVIGKDQKGIIARISNAVFKHNINIEDLKQMDLKIQVQHENIFKAMHRV
jgi:predicted amino acid-binding ACT domain protein